MNMIGGDVEMYKLTESILKQCSFSNVFPVGVSVLPRVHDVVYNPRDSHSAHVSTRAEVESADHAKSVDSIHDKYRLNNLYDADMCKFEALPGIFSHFA